MNYQDIKDIVDSWEGCNLSDISTIISYRRDLSALYYQLSEHKAQQESQYLDAEVERKSHFNEHKLIYMQEDKDSATKAETRAYVNSKHLYLSEKRFESEYKKAKDMLSSLDHILNAMSSAIKVGENEKRQGGYHV